MRFERHLRRIDLEQFVQDFAELLENFLCGLHDSIPCDGANYSQSSRRVSISAVFRVAFPRAVA
jgi:hypothetical protein